MARSRPRPRQRKTAAAAWSRARNPARRFSAAVYGRGTGKKGAIKLSSPGYTVVVQVYLCPLGRLVGDAARVALAGGWALPLGGDAAFAGCEIWQRGPQGSRREILAAGELAAWLDRQCAEIRERTTRWCERLAAPSSWPAGLPRRRPLVMGVVNVTPDSFADGGRFFEPAAAIAQGLRLRAEGADIVDLGGESTRPGAAPVPEDEEIRRVVPVIEALAAREIPVSIDTRKAAVMAAAVAAGARMINDVSALRHDPKSFDVAGASGLPVVLMHSQGEPATMQVQPTYDIAPLDVFDQLAERVDAWTTAGFERARLLIDPGIGFGKTVDHNLEILSRLGLYLGLGLPILLGVSRKSFIGRLAGGAPPKERRPGSLAAAVHGLAAGAAVLRVHDVAATQQAIAIWQSLAGLPQLPLHSGTTGSF